MLSIAGRSPSWETVALSTVGLGFAIYLLRDVIIRAFFSMAMKAAESEQSSNNLDENGILNTFRSLVTADEEGSISLFLVWSLIDAIRRILAPWTSKTVLAVHSEGIPYATYPEEALANLDGGEDEEIEVESGIKVIVTEDLGLEVWIDIESYHILKQTVEKAENEDVGEAVIISGVDELLTLYRIATAIYKTVNEGANEELAAYYGVKTLLLLAKKGAIRVPLNLWGVLRSENRELWARVEEQLREEGLF
jgi:hypothetical protein